MIVLEGVDATGKSTLAVEILKQVPFEVQRSEGPPQYGGEMERRVKVYMSRYPYNYPILFDRHPCVSQPIYGSLRSTHFDPIPQHLIQQFYQRDYLFIYCDPLNRGLVDHVVKDGENPEHVRAVEENYRALLAAYRKWALQHAHYIYRIGDDMDLVVDLCLTTWLKRVSRTNPTPWSRGS